MNFVSYTRISTQRQQDSGLGLAAQQVAIKSLVNQHSGKVVAEFTETESGRKGAGHRPELDKALAACKEHKAVLVIGKIDRLARNVSYFLNILDSSKVDIRFADLPDVCPKSDEGRMLLITMANFAEFEGRRIGTRTRAALAVAKSRGVKLGVKGAENLRSNIEERKASADAFAGNLQDLLASFKQRGMAQRKQVAELNQLGIKSATGRQWGLIQLQRVLARIPATAATA